MDSQNATITKISYRLLPLLVLGYLIAFIDRVNVGFAMQSMHMDLHISMAAFGFGAGLFYITYVLFEIPSNMFLEKVGAKVWISRIMVTWGIVSVCGALVSGEKSFYLIRLLLGIAEAGFFPGIILYITHWFPPKYRANIIAIFMVSVPLSSFIGSPISASIMQLDGLLGLRDWQLLFILEGIPAIILGVLVFFLLPNKPQEAKWLTNTQKQWLASELYSQPKGSIRSASFKSLFNKKILALAVIYAGASGASQCLAIWQPSILNSLGFSGIAMGVLNAIPFGVACVLMIVWGRSSDTKGERVYHTQIPLLCVSIFLVVMAFVFSHAFLVMVCLVVAVSATYMFKGPFWALCSEYLPAGLVAFGLAEINAIGNLAGFIGSTLIGIIRSFTGSFTYAMVPIALIALLGCTLLYQMTHTPKTDQN
ncbi:MFS transporter [Helicobacter sp. 12S02634-8]|uniref:MFS transporter n=1 Tax=Helicobacter sp. 12S02634-8 TaxID=1476199 RepID=UPI000BA51500|nr:MFS transporter [Helicobacter sp. 12S02634-8]PAF47373.1 MFS transporter [Helicobacter sp. 12S02634-8]